MITKHDLDCAIAECQGDPNPNAQTCMKLASYYTIQEHLFPDNNVIEHDTSYSYASEPIDSAQSVNYDSESEFAQIINGKDINEVLSIMDELMETLEVINPRLYNGVIARLS